MLYILNERYQWGQMLGQHTLAHKCIYARTQKKQMQIYMKLEKNVSIQYRKTQNHLSLYFNSYSLNQFPMSGTT